MKKCMLVTFITIAVLGYATTCFSQTDRTVTNTTKKGSLLIYPLIKVGPGDTLIQLTNNYYLSVKIRCVYDMPTEHSRTGWTMTLLPNQSVAWLASTARGPDGRSIPLVPTRLPQLASGALVQLRCWAVDDSGSQQIAWNWLTGSAIVDYGNNRSWEYSAWRFAVNSSTTGSSAGTAGTLQMTGDTGNYDACPTALLFNFLTQQTTTDPYPAGTVENKLTLVPCGMDSVYNNTMIYTEFVARNETGDKRGSPYTCIGNATASTWYSESLTSTKLHVPSSQLNPFVNNNTPGGSILVHGRQNENCEGSQGIPLLGVMSMQFTSGSGPVAGGTPTAVGPGQGYVRDGNDNNTTTPVVTVR